MRALVIGDVHAVEDELEDCQALIDGVVPVVERHKPDAILFLGDQAHAFGLANVEVMAWWRKTFTRLRQLAPVKALVGNHDLAAAGVSPSHSMLAFADLIQVVDLPVEEDGVLYIPYAPSHDIFRGWVAASTAKTVVCHQTILGATYENGFFASDGVSIAGFEDRHFVSGHIHCFDNDTEILTRSGWKSRTALQPDDQVVGMNLTSSRLEWQPIEEIVDSAPQPVVSIRSKQVDLVVSHGHELLVQVRSYSKRPESWKKIRADAQGVGNLKIPISGAMTRPSLPYTDDEIRLMVWIAADGHISPEHYIRWHLRKTRKIERLTALLTRLGAPFTVNAQAHGTVKVNLLDSDVRDRTKKWFNSSDKHLPSLLLGADFHQARVILAEYEVTDGHRNGNQVQIGTALKVEVNILQTIFVTNGIACTATPKKGLSGFTYLKCLADKEFSEVYLPRNRTFLDKSIQTWCVRTPTTTVMVRRNGHVSITGNCPHKFGNVLYPGSPRWRIATDANTDKAVHVIDFTPEGPKVIESVLTDTWCSKLVLLKDSSIAPLLITELNPRHRYIVDIHGPPAYIQERKAMWAGCRVRTFPTKVDAPKVAESMGVGKALRQFVGGYQPKYGTPVPVLERMAADRLGKTFA